IRTAERRTARQAGSDSAMPLLAGPPYHQIASHQGWQVGAHMAAKTLAVFVFQLDLHAKVGNYQSLLFKPELALFQLVHGALFAALGAGNALGLDFVNAPALAAAQFAFAHTGLSPCCHERSAPKQITATVNGIIKYSMASPRLLASPLPLLCRIR